MQPYSGDPNFPIWLIGHSPPKAWEHKLDTPLDPRHPARHSIWTAVADPMQDRLYRQARLRLDTSRLYVRNAKNDATPLDLEEDIRICRGPLKELLDNYRPPLVLTFGAVAFMVALAANGEPTKQKFNTAKLLGGQFNRRIERFDPGAVNVIPFSTYR